MSVKNYIRVINDLFFVANNTRFRSKLHHCNNNNLTSVTVIPSNENGNYPEEHNSGNTSKNLCDTLVFISKSKSRLCPNMTSLLPH